MEIIPTTAIIVISILSLIVLILGFTTWNLLKKNEKGTNKKPTKKTRTSSTYA